MGVRMGQVFELARECADMEPPEIEALLDERFHEPRAGAVRIMATQARGKRTTEERRQELYELYLRRHDRIDNWDLVDLGAWDVVGSWLVDRPRDILYELARSRSMGNAGRRSSRRWRSSAVARSTTRCASPRSCSVTTRT
jgi:hypothetical protein